MVNKNYRTRQKEQILNYLMKSPNYHFTVQEIYDYLNKLNSSVGTTTIYRNLEKLVSEGIVKKYILDGENCAYFEYIGENSENIAEFHFKCNKCGKLFHFECSHLKNLYIHFLNEHNMNIDLLKTVYYGVCDKCNNLKKEQKND